MTGTAPSLAELEATLADQAKVKDLVTTGKLGDFIKDYASAKTKAADPAELERQVKEQAQLALRDLLLGADGAKPLRPNLGTGDGRSRNRFYNKRAPGVALDKHFDDRADFFQSIWHLADSLPNADELAGKRTETKKIQNSFGSTVPADGGFLIPEILRSEILSVALESSVVRPRAVTIPMSSLRLPMPAVDETTHAGSVFGGITAYWTEEAANATESQAKFGQVVLEAKKLVVYCETPNELVADAPAFDAFLGQMLPAGVAFFEDLAFIMGNGVGQPLGALNPSNPGIIKVNQATANKVQWVDVVKMFARVLPQSMTTGVWLAAPDTFPDLAQMTVATGDATTTRVGPPVWIPNGVGAPPISLLGRPVIFSEKVPALGTDGALAFIDFGFYLIGDRQAMQATSSPHYRFQADKTAYKVTERVDGRPWIQSPLTPANGSTQTLSPYVLLGDI